MTAARSTYEAWEPTLHAFTHIVGDVQPQPHLGPLAGVPFAAKDVFDTAGIPTEYGSPLFRGRTPAATAPAVQRLQDAGAHLFGKTVTAELAYFAPGPTSNPWDPTRTPGGSSMGSAAAVAAGIVPLALGTQTNGSTIRPAAFCGCIGFKPTFGRLPTNGALRFSQTLDHIGVFADTVARLAQACAVIADQTPQSWFDTAIRNAPRLGIVRTPEWDDTTTAMQRLFEQTVANLENAVDLPMPPPLAEALPVLATIMAAEADQNILPLVKHDLARVSPQLTELLERGGKISPAAYSHARQARLELQGLHDEWSDPVDALVTLAALGEAPPLSTTGDPICCTRWTLLGVPAISLPCGRGEGGLPLAVQLVGKPGRDGELLRIAAQLASRLPALGRPPLPDA